MLKIVSKILMILLIAILFLNAAANTIYAAVEVSINKAYIEKIGEAKYHLKYYREDGKEYRYLTCDIVGFYDKKGNFNPAYCMNRDLKGAGEKSYSVNINNLLKNDKVWRVIKNGYPYKSAKELGLSSKEDAFVVTKHAVYCILGEGKLNYYKAEKEDREAVAMLNALRKLVEIGEKGTEKQQDNPLAIAKVGELKEEGENFVQEYKVNSKSDFNNYEISKTTNMPKNAYIADKSLNKTTKFKSTENFKVVIPKQNITTNTEIKITAKADCKAYIILEGKTTVTKTQNYVVTAGEYATATAETKLQVEAPNASISINKIAEDTKEPLKGVKFEIYKNKQLVETKETDEEGKIKFEKLYSGKYILKEVETNENYVLESKEQEIELKSGENKEITITNKLKQGQVKVIKVDKDNNELKLEGVKFEVQDKDGKVLEVLTTDKNGEATTMLYALKDYENIYLKETETNSKYVLNDNIVKVKLEEGQIKNVTFENEKIKGKIKIVKTSKDYNKITKQKAGTPLSGVKFEIYNSENNLVGTVTTNKNGVALTSDLEKGEYRIKEIETNKYYYINPQDINVNIENNKQELVVNITNESTNPEVDIEKNGPNRAEVGGKIEYDISIRNTGNTSLDNFTMIDLLPSDYISVNTFKTGTFNQDTKYNLYYKTNMSNGYILLMEDLKSKENYEINLKEELADNETVTEIKMEFEKVDIGFCSNENPHITGTVKKTVKSEQTFTNTATVSGEYDKYKVEKKSKWKTVSYKILPKTGF